MASEVSQSQLLEAAHDPLSAWLDTKVSQSLLWEGAAMIVPPLQYGAEIRDLGIFATLTRHWEQEFHSDMDELGVSVTMPPPCRAVSHALSPCRYCHLMC